MDEAELREKIAREIEEMPHPGHNPDTDRFVVDWDEGYDYAAAQAAGIVRERMVVVR